MMASGSFRASPSSLPKLLTPDIMGCASASASSSGFIQNCLDLMPWCALPAPLHHSIQKFASLGYVWCVLSCAPSSSLPKTSLDRTMVCALSAPLQYLLQNKLGSPKWCALPPASSQNTIIYPKTPSKRLMVLATVLSFRKHDDHHDMSPFRERLKTYHYGRHGCGKSREIVVEDDDGRSRNLPEKHE